MNTDNKISVYNPGKEKILVLAPHPDDEVLGCGGTILRHAQAGSEIFCLYLNKAEQSRSIMHIKNIDKRVQIKTAETKTAVHKLNIRHFDFIYKSNKKIPDSHIKRKIENIVSRYKPQLIYLPWYGEIHPEHRIMGIYLRQIEITMNLLKETYIHAYEVGVPIPYPDIYVDISTEMEDKINILKSYETAVNHIDYAKTVEGLNSYRSLHINGGHGYFETFIRHTFRGYLCKLNYSATISC